MPTRPEGHGRRGLTEGDRAAWSAYVRQVRPLPGRAMPDPPVPAGMSPPATPIDVMPQPRRTPQRLSPLVIGRQPPGMDNATWRRFSSGKLAPQRRLDLHGHTAQAAFQAFHGLLNAAAATGLRCIEVITGRGAREGGVIRREFALWLNLPELRPSILAAAHPHAANPGSTLLLLRRTGPPARARPRP